MYIVGHIEVYYISIQTSSFPRLAFIFSADVLTQSIESHSSSNGQQLN